MRLFPSQTLRRMVRPDLAGVCGRRPTMAVLAILVVVAIGGGLARAGGVTPSRRAQGAQAAGAIASRHPAPRATVTISPAGLGRPIPAGFVGLSMETDGLTSAGGPLGPPDPVLAQLIRSLSPGAQPVLRIGGNSTDYSWAPIPGLREPPHVHYALDAGWLAEVRQLAQATNARLILGVNLESGNLRLASTEARALVNGIGRKSIMALELGNEPELYPTITSGTPRGARPAYVPARQFAAFARVFRSVAGAVAGIGLAGPSTGSDHWLPFLHSFLTGERRVGVVTVHRYPFKHCGGGQHNSIRDLLTTAASHDLAQSLVPSVRVAHSNARGIRVDEMNAVSCGGQAGVSDSFASALWVLNSLFEMARVGVDGVNIHTRPSSMNQLFSLSHRGAAWSAAVRPEYYGLLTFAVAAPAGSRLLRITQPGTPGLHVWATRTASRNLHVVLINETSRRQALNLRLGSPGPFSRTVLRATRLGASGAVTLGGQSFGSSTTTGLLAGAQRIAKPRPMNGSLHVVAPPFSAVVLASPG